MKSLLTFTLSLVAATALFAEQKPMPPPSSRVPDSIEFKADLQYAGNDNPWQAVDLFLPKNRATDKPLPVVVYIHGGGWSGGNRRGGGMAAGFAARHSGRLHRTRIRWRRRVWGL